ncbi:MAG TPA: hypothetical protein VLS89_05110, partial [Candidatus Nanopelagicales bacterium]|nr:hypothetical protein [Candidatus Nanopelagicales bacterium]
MLKEEWVNYIKNVMSPTAFKEVGMAALRVMVGRPVVLADGTGDGGVDAWVEQSPTTRVPVQLYAGHADWYRKLVADVQKSLVRDSHVRRLYFVCAQTPSPELVQDKLAEIERDHGIAVTLIDARGIASQADRPAVLDALRKVSSLSPAERPVRSWSAAVEARLAFAFFHESTGDFRAEVARSVLATCFLRAESPIPTEKLLDQALSLLGGATHLKRLFRRQLESFVASGDVVVEAGSARGTPALIERTKGWLSIQASAEEKLRDDCVGALEGRVHSPELRRQAVDAVFDDLGLLLRRSLIEKLPGAQGHEASLRLDAVERRLSDALKPSGGTAQEALQALIAVASGSAYGQSMASAELFIHMTERNTSEIARALTGRERVEVVLDTSVAMPTLCGALDRVAKGWLSIQASAE